MKFWQSLAFVELDQMVELAQFCEQLGFYGVSYGDHLVTTKEQVDEYQYGKDGNDPGGAAARGAAARGRRSGPGDSQG